MLKTRVMPCLLVQDGRLVKSIQFKKLNYIGDPVNAIKIYNEKEVDELIIADITATIDDRSPPFELIEEITGECFMPMAYSGAIRSIDDIRTIFKLGVEKVGINSYAYENPAFVSEAARIFGNQSIIASIDVKKTMFGGYKVFTRHGTKNTGEDPVAYAKKMESLGAGEILLNSIDRDGMMDGYDCELVRKITDAVNIPVIALGGAGEYADIAKVVQEGKASAVAAGSLFIYQGRIRSVLINFPLQEELKRLVP